MTVSGQRFRADWNKTIGVNYTAGRWHDMSLLTGAPVANAFTGTALNAQVADENSGYGMFHGGNVSALTKHLINMGAVGNAATTVPGTLMLIDMCLYYPGISLTSASVQNLVNGSSLTRYTNGVGLRPYLVVTAATGVNTPSIAMSYTRQTTGGTDTGRALGAATNLTASAIIGHISHSGTATNNRGPFLPLQSGDTGIKSVQSVTITTPHATSGTAALVLARPIMEIPMTVANAMTERDLVTQLPSMPKIEDGACLTWIYLAGAATVAGSIISGKLEFGWG